MLLRKLLEVAALTNVVLELQVLEWHTQLRHHLPGVVQEKVIRIFVSGKLYKYSQCE